MQQQLEIRQKRQQPFALSLTQHLIQFAIEWSFLCVEINGGSPLLVIFIDNVTLVLHVHHRTEDVVCKVNARHVCIAGLECLKERERERERNGFF